MIVLAIDPGSITAGFAVLQRIGRRIIYLDSGIMRFNSSDLFLDRIPDIFQQTNLLIEKYAPDEIALESLIFVKSPTALIKLAQSRGAMLAALSQKYQNRIFEYSPNLVKSTVTGHGHADKLSIQKFISQYLGVREFKSHDESDALAIALCHHLSYGQNVTQMTEIKRNKLPAKGRGLKASLAHRIKEISK